MEIIARGGFCLPPISSHSCQHGEVCMLPVFPLLGEKPPVPFIKKHKGMDSSQPIMNLSFGDLKTLQNYLPSFTPVTLQSLEPFSISAMVNMFQKVSENQCFILRIYNSGNMYLSAAVLI